MHSIVYLLKLLYQFYIHMNHVLIPVLTCMTVVFSTFLEFDDRSESSRRHKDLYNSIQDWWK
jgi:hypothetical protein